MKLCKDCKHCEAKKTIYAERVQYKCKTTARANLVDGASEWEEMKWCSVNRIGGRVMALFMGSCGEHGRFWEDK